MTSGQTSTTRPINPHFLSEFYRWFDDRGFDQFCLTREVALEAFAAGYYTDREDLRRPALECLGWLRGDLDSCERDEQGRVSWTHRNLIELIHNLERGLGMPETAIAVQPVPQWYWDDLAKARLARLEAQQTQADASGEAPADQSQATRKD